MDSASREESKPSMNTLDLEAIATAGHSFGGYTPLALAGQTFILPLRMTRVVAVLSPILLPVTDFTDE